MTETTTAGAAASASDAPLGVLVRVAGMLFDRIDFQKDTIDGLRDDLDEARGERDSALHVAQANAEAGAAHALGAEAGERHLRSCERALISAQEDRDRFRLALETIRDETDGSMKLSFSARDRIRSLARVALGEEIPVEVGELPEVETDPRVAH